MGEATATCHYHSALGQKKRRITSLKRFRLTLHWVASSIRQTPTRRALPPPPPPPALLYSTFTALRFLQVIKIRVVRDYSSSNTKGKRIKEAKQCIHPERGITLSTTRVPVVRRGNTKTVLRYSNTSLPLRPPAVCFCGGVKARETPNTTLLVGR